MNGPVRHLAIALFLGFALLVGAVTWHQIIVGPDYRDDSRNLRLVAGRTGRERGTIITADGVVVSRSVADPDDPRVFRREYPEGPLYSHVVGYSTLLFGSSGLEQTRGDDLVSNRDATISGVIRAILGGDVRAKGLGLTINHELQQLAATALGDQRGAVVALDPRTGAILAMVSAPTFDANDLLGGGVAAAGDALAADPDAPLLNRVIAETYAPGSTFKIITTSAALETGVAGPATEFDDPIALELPGSTAVIRNFSRGPCGDGDSVELQRAFARSCNTTFAALGLEVGANDLVSTAQAFGVNSDVPFDLTSLASFVPATEEFDFNLAGLAQTAIGERDVRVTPLQMALVGAAIANGGEIMEPYLVAEVFNSDATIESVTEPVVWRRAISPATAATIADLMELAVTSGTGTRAAVPGIRIGGKTGTAEVPGGPPHSWFVGYGPVEADEDTPQIVVAVLVESGGDAGESATGGTVAAPIAQQLMAAFFGVPLAD
ncbi:MAG: penicillin-binding protein 2 [Acidimicrobiia bacterium]|nr:penicillin-binding protein 2 [Acidimicrobiia bacterium]